MFWKMQILTNITSVGDRSMQDIRNWSKSLPTTCNKNDPIIARDVLRRMSPSSRSPIFRTQIYNRQRIWVKVTEISNGNNLRLKTRLLIHITPAKTKSSTQNSRQKATQLTGINNRKIPKNIVNATTSFQLQDKIGWVLKVSLVSNNHKVKLNQVTRVLQASICYCTKYIVTCDKKTRHCNTNKT